MLKKINILNFLRIFPDKPVCDQQIPEPNYDF